MPPLDPALEPHASRPSHAVTGCEGLRLLSANLRELPLDQLERVTPSGDAAVALCRTLAAAGIEAVMLVTCNRSELYWHSRGARDDARVRAALAAALGGDPAGAFAEARADEAARHLFRVAAGLESELVGEPEVLGQVREAHERSQAAGAAGSVLGALFHAARRAGGRARQETEIGVGALTVASAGALRLLQDPARPASGTVLVVGAGRVGRAAAQQFASAGVARIVVLNRTPERARELAARVRGESAPLAALPEWLAVADAALFALHAPAPVVTAPAAAAALAGRAARPLVLVDLSLPRAVHPGAGEVAGVRLHDLSALEEIVAANRARRAREIPRVETLLERELEAFRARARQRLANGAIAELRRRTEALVRAELAASLGDAVPAAALDHTAQRLADRLLVAPTRALADGNAPLDQAHALYLRRLFGLKGDDDAGA